MEDKTYKVINKDSKHPIILTCEHASNKIPKGYENLGLEYKYFDTHIARDKGCREITTELANRIGATAFVAEYSRLFVDLNRKTSEAELIVPVSDKITILGNQNISDDERKNRIEKFYKPYHQAIDNKIQSLKEQGIEPIIFSIHAYTSQLQGGAFRPWNCGILYLEKTEFTKKIIKNIQKIEGLTVGLNEPYDLRKYKTGSSVIHGYDQNLDNCLIEIRDSEFDDLNSGVEKWVKILYDIIS